MKSTVMEAQMKSCGYWEERMVTVRGEWPEKVWVMKQYVLSPRIWVRFWWGWVREVWGVAWDGQGAVEGSKARKVRVSLTYITVWQCPGLLGIIQETMANPGQLHHPKCSKSWEGNRMKRRIYTWLLKILKSWCIFDLVLSVVGIIED